MGDTNDVSGGVGIFVAILTLVAGIVAVAARKSKGGAIATSIIYGISGIMGVASNGIFGDLIIWSIINLAFAVVFIVSIFVQNCDKTNKTAQ